jgi:DNA protecting protein DprA
MEVYWLWLSHLKGIGPATLRKLVDHIGSPKAVYEASHEELKNIPGLRKGIAETILKERALDKAQRVQEQMSKYGIKLLTYNEPNFPSYINRFSHLPAVLFYRGNLRPSRVSVGIVGSRRCTSYGKEVAAEVAAFLGQAGITVASGMAKGIDSYAHTACLKAGGYTIAFVANGLDICYPPEHQNLMEEIIEKGAILSPYPPGTSPRPEYFPFRNKLLSAWVDKLLVVEAAERSGALLTAGYAMEYGRTVLAVPNSIYSLESKGCNRLLMSGAEVYLEPEQFPDKQALGQAEEVEFIVPIHRMRQERECSPNGTQEKLILGQLNQGPLDINRFLDIFNGDLSALLETLCQLELEGKISVRGQRISRC